jgi:hypothetical protein
MMEVAGPVVVKAEGVRAAEVMEAADKQRT